MNIKRTEGHRDNKLSGFIRISVSIPSGNHGIIILSLAAVICRAPKMNNNFSFIQVINAETIENSDLENGVGAVGV
jgi:hypothetical protein